MENIGAFEAKTHLSQLLDRVENGEEITISRHGRPVARLSPLESVVGSPEKVKLAVAGWLKIRNERNITLGGSGWQELRDDGRR